MLYHYQLMPDTMHITLLATTQDVVDYEHHQSALFYKILELVQEAVDIDSFDAVQSNIKTHLSTEIHEETDQGLTHAIMQSAEMQSALGATRRKWQEISPQELRETEKYGTDEIMDQELGKMTRQQVKEIFQNTTFSSYIESLLAYA